MPPRSVITFVEVDHPLNGANDVLSGTLSSPHAVLPALLEAHAAARKGYKGVSRIQPYSFCLSKHFIERNGGRFRCNSATEDFARVPYCYRVRVVEVTPTGAPRLVIDAYRYARSEGGYRALCERLPLEEAVCVLL